jgi:hypothetical protein
MTEKKVNAVMPGINQPSIIQFPKINQDSVDVVKNSMLYSNAKRVIPEKKPSKLKSLQLGSPGATNGWDTVSMCSVSALNEKIKAEKTYPATIMQERGDISLDGVFNAWKIVLGGDGKNIKLELPLKSGTYKGLDFDSGETFDLKGVSIKIYIKLNYLPESEEKDIPDGDYNLFVKTNDVSESDPIATVISLDDPSGKMDDINKSILRGLFETWLNMPENLAKFDTLFATALINNFGEQSEDFKWLRSTAISYAYTDQNTAESSIFGVLCMTNGRSKKGLPNQLPAYRLEKDDNAKFIINREIFVKYQLLPSLPFIFDDSPDATYELDRAGTTIVGKNIKLESVRVGLIDYHPVADSFEISFEDEYIRTTLQTHTNISPGIVGKTVMITKQTLVLGENDAGEQIMTYEMVGEPIIQNSTDIATWVIVTEAIVSLIGAVVTGVAAKIASKIFALIVGIIAAVVVAVIGIVIHGIIAKAIAGGIASAIPSISPMVTIATNQIKWPFCQDDAFMLSDIEYSGAIIFSGVLKLIENYTLKNNKLYYAGELTPA